MRAPVHPDQLLEPPFSVIAVSEHAATYLQVSIAHFEIAIIVNFACRESAKTVWKNLFRLAIKVFYGHVAVLLPVSKTILLVQSRLQFSSGAKTLVIPISSCFTYWRLVVGGLGFHADVLRRPYVFN